MSRTRSLAVGAAFQTIFVTASFAALALWALLVDTLRHYRVRPKTPAGAPGSRPCACQLDRDRQQFIGTSRFTRGLPRA